MPFMTQGSIFQSAQGASVCAVCAAPIDPDAQVCARCGSVANRIGRCSHCQTLTSLEPHKDLLWICSVCGAARMTQASCEHITAVRSDLRSATHAHRLAKLSQVASCFGAGIGLVGLLLVLTIQSVFSPNGLTAWAMISLPFLTLVLSVLGFVKTRHLQKTRNALLDNAYGLAILELMSKSTTGATPVQLAESFGIQPSIAERLLAQLNVRDDMTSEVTDDGQIADFTKSKPIFREKSKRTS